MAYPGQFLKLTFGFFVIGTKEIAQTSLHLYGGPTFDAVAALADWDDGDAQDIANSYNSELMAATSLYWADYSTLSTVKLAAVGTNGLYLTDPHVTELGTPHTGGTNGPIGPQCSRIVTFRSGSGIGVANVGRMYLPHTAGPLTSGSPYLTTATVSSLTAKAVLFYGDVNTKGGGLGTGCTWQLLSRKGSGTAKPITLIGCDNIIDTQRRRYDKLIVGRTLTAV